MLIVPELKRPWWAAALAIALTVSFFAILISVPPEWFMELVFLVWAAAISVVLRIGLPRKRPKFDYPETTRERAERERAEREADE